MPGRQQIYKKQACVLGAFWVSPEGGAHDFPTVIFGLILGTVFNNKYENMHPKINVRINIEKRNENVAIEAKGAPQMKPKWS